MNVSSAVSHDTTFESIILDDFREIARSVLSKAVFDYIDAVAMDGLTSSANRADFDRLALLPLSMRDVSSPDLSVNYFGRTSPLPFGISPMAFHQLAHPDGETASASAAQVCGTPIIVSAMSSRSLEDIAAHSQGGRLWLHVYLFRNRALTYDLIARAQDAGFEAISIGLGCPALGKRPVNLRNRFLLPEGIAPVNLGLSSAKSGSLSWADAELDPAATWVDVERVCRRTNLPVIGKGIINRLDVDPALNAGLSGLLVSNHGGRQLDGCPSSIRVLSEIVADVNGRVPVFLDGGVRRGTDVLKALLLGASAVFVGRPVLWALSADGINGVVQLMSILADELRLAMQLIGCSSLKDAPSMAADVMRCGQPMDNPGGLFGCR